MSDDVRGEVEKAESVAGRSQAKVRELRKGRVRRERGRKLG